jgi:hypothetical protein
VSKLANHDRFLRTLTSVPWFPLTVARASSRLVPVCELAVACGLVVEPRLAAYAVLGLLAVFSVVIAIEFSSGREFSCGCFGGSTEQPVGVFELVRNALLVSFAVIVLFAQAVSGSPAALLGVECGLALLTLEVGREMLLASQQ